MTTWSRKPRALAVLDDAMEIFLTLRRIELLNKIRRASEQLKASGNAPLLTAPKSEGL